MKLIIEIKDVTVHGQTGISTTIRVADFGTRREVLVATHLAKQIDGLLKAQPGDVVTAPLTLRTVKINNG